MWHKGKPVNAIEGLVAVGLFKDQADIDSWPTQDFGGTVRPGDIKYLDLNGDRKVDGNDVTMLGHPTVPELVYGLGASIRYKKFDFSFFFQGVGRVSLLMSDHHPFVSKAYSGRNMTRGTVERGPYAGLFVLDPQRRLPEAEECRAGLHPPVVPVLCRRIQPADLLEVQTVGPGARQRQRTEISVAAGRQARRAVQFLTSPYRTRL